MTSTLKYLTLACLPLVLGVTAASEAVAQQNGASNSQSLQDALRRIARNSNDSSALADAGLAALELGDTRAAIGFLAKADQIYPRSGRVKAGLARALLLEENPFGAIRYFDQAVKNGVSLRSIASDRGLAYDLIGRNTDAQKDYELAMQYDDSDDLRSRYAISLGISGEIEKAEAALNPLLQKSDRDAWRNRAFMLAMNGREKDANAITRQTMQRRMARAIEPFLARMPKLTAAQKAAAVHFGHFPASENIGVDVASVRYASNTAVRGGDGADAGLIPLGKPLGTEVKKPRVLAMPDTSARRRPGRKRGEEVRRVTKRELRRMERRGIKYTVLNESDLPKPASAKPKTKPAAQVAESKLAVKASTNSAAKPKQVSVEKAITAAPPLAKRGNSKNNRVLSQSPGFETALGVTGQSRAAKPAPKPVQIAANGFSAPTVSAEEIAQSKTVLKTPTAKTQTSVIARQAQSPTPLVSESIFRKVDIGGSNSPQKSLPASGQASVSPPLVSKPEPKPTELASFNLNTVPAAPRGNGNVPIRMAQAEPAKRPLADIINSISIPEAERKTDVVPVDLRKITPAKKQPKVDPEPKEQVKKPEPKKEMHPKRYWVQIATGANMNALKYDYRRMAKKNGRLFADKSGWTSPWGRTRRLVVGPFDSLGEAKKFESGFRKGGGDGFAWVSSKGTEVNKLTK